MGNKLFFRAIAALLTLVLLLIVFVALHGAPRFAKVAVRAPVAAPPQSATILPSGNVAPAPTSSGPVSDKMVGVVIQNSDIQSLASGLGLQVLGETNSGAAKPAARAGDPQWARGIGRAQELLQGMCTCHQRNWLLHFIDCGNYALAGDPKYNQAVQELATIPITE